jgi:hypothetical protein
MKMPNMKFFFFVLLALVCLGSAQLGTTEEWKCGNINLDANGHIINDMDSWLIKF